MDRPTKQTISGPLQERIMMLLRDRPLCGKDLMGELSIKSPGTIYPALEELKRKGLIDFRLEVSGAVRRKTYDLTAEGRKHLRDNMASSAKMFCCDLSLYADTILRDARGIMEVRKHQKVLSTLDFVDLRGYLNGAEVTYESDTDTKDDRYDVILAFTGVSCLIGRKERDLSRYFASLRPKLREEGRLLAVEIESTDNLFARIFFEDIRKMSRMPGMSSTELEEYLHRAGYEEVKVISRSGLLYGLASVKPQAPRPMPPA